MDNILDFNLEASDFNPQSQLSADFLFSFNTPPPQGQKEK
jgi:hypothetical protein